MSRIIPLSEVKVALSRLIDDIVVNEDEIVITRNGKAVAVLMNADEFEGWKETLEIMSDPETMRRIRKNLGDINKGDSKTYESTDEFFKSLE
jgi:antitoxin YefM